MEEFTNSEYIYLIHPREFIRMKQSVYKIGRTAQSPDKRLGQYPKNTKLYFLLAVDNCIDTETMLLRVFRKQFNARTDYGSEYFEGDLQEMIETIVESVRPPKKLLKCDACHISITSNSRGSPFCCGVYHNMCIERTGKVQCPRCNRSFKSEKLYVSNPVLTNMFTSSKFCESTSILDDSTVCAVYGDRNDPETFNNIVECLTSGKPTYLFINPEHSNFERNYFSSIARMCEDSVRHCHRIHSFICFQPLEYKSDISPIADTLLGLNYSSSCKWVDVFSAEPLRPDIISEKIITSPNHTLPTYAQLEHTIHILK